MLASLKKLSYEAPWKAEAMAVSVSTGGSPGYNSAEELPVPTGVRALAREAQRPSRVDDLRIPSVLKCGALIFILKAALNFRGFAWAIKWIRCRVESVPVTPAVNLAVVTATDSAVAVAGALYPGRALCLEQSLVLFYLLRSQGIPVRYCHGVRPHPFQAHAWIEYQGVPINDVPEHVALFRRLPDLLP